MRPADDPGAFGLDRATGSSGPEEYGKHGLGDFGGSFLVTEQARPFDHCELGVRERPHHLFGPCDRKEAIARSPHELHGALDPTVQFGQLPDQSYLEAAEHLDGGSTPLGRGVEGFQEEFVELSIEKRRVHEGVSEHELVPSESRLSGDPAQCSTQTGQVPDGDERPEAPAELAGLLRIDERHASHTRIARQCVSSDQAPAVVPDDGDVVELEQLHHPPEGCDVLIERQWRVGIESARSGPREVYDVARHLSAQKWQERSERRSADRPSVHEEHIGSLADPTVGNVAGSDVEERVGRTPEEVGSFSRGERGHETSVES
jgi:hypothetical protein